MQSSTYFVGSFVQVCYGQILLVILATTRFHLFYQSK